jgi:hypothetical protein
VRLLHVINHQTAVAAGRQIGDFFFEMKDKLMMIVG